MLFRSVRKFLWLVKIFDWIVKFENFQIVFIISIYSLNIQYSLSQQCGTCNTANGVACLSTTQYIYCNSTALDFTTIFTCPSTPSTYQCNSETTLVDYPCYLTSNTDFTPSCKRAPQTIVFTFNATNWCSKIVSYGLFKHPTLSCAWFVKCYPFNSATAGTSLRCPQGTLFNPTAKFCDSTKTSCWMNEMKNCRKSFSLCLKKSWHLE